ncbi:MAG: alpha/beta hydrolase fold domain-containing protein [Pseudonocardia sp.]|jgi:cation diffusion facilitator CzcD-associated flavoprotein CzcO/acetyl esterase/lipase
MTDDGSRDIRTRAVRQAAKGLSVLLSPRTPVPVQRAGMVAALAPLPGPRDVRVTSGTLGGRPVEWLAPKGADPATVVLYLHGGGYVIGSPRTHRGMVAELVTKLGATAAVLDYRMGPEFRHPAALDDAAAAYRELIASGYPAERIVLAGDSAGGGLSLALAMRLRGQDVPAPAAVAMICPWVDARPDLARVRPEAPREPLLRSASLANFASLYTPDGADDPEISPVLGELAGLPPLIMHSAGDDPLAADADLLMERAAAAGVTIDHRRYPGLWHDFHSMPRLLPAADAALGHLADSIRAHLPAPTPTPRVAIVGAGMSGVCMGAKLLAAGVRDFTIYEKAGEVGGTWRDNTYPGLTCDVPSRYYSYSFAPDPGWSHVFPEGPELQRYFVRSADRLGLRPHLRFNSEVVEATWTDGRWRLRTADGHTDTVDVLVTATGVLHHPNVPDIPGLDSFAGPSFHSARWDHSVNVEGKRVGLVGTGSTGVQITCALSKVVGKLVVFQRTAQWVMPVPNRPYTALSRAVMRRVPKLNRISYRAYQATMERLFSAVINAGPARTLVNTSCRLALRTVRDPQLRRKITPSDQPMCKRLVMSPSYHRAVQRPTVEIVTDGIERVVPEGVVTKDGTTHELDVLVLATGFDARAYVRPMAVTGQDGATLDERWKDGPHAYRTVAMPGFPNFFMLMGPHSPIGNHSLIAIAEVQADYVISWIERLRRGSVSSFAPTDAATRDYNQQIREALPGTVWASGCKSWYLGPDGLPELWPWSPGRHREMLREPETADFELNGSGGSRHSAVGG